MDEKTEELRDIFLDATGSDTVTESQEEHRGSLTADRGRVESRLTDIVGTMRQRYTFRTDLDDETLVSVVRGFYDGADDDAIAATVDETVETVVTARLDLHLVRASDRETDVDLETLRTLVQDGADRDACVAELDADAGAVERALHVVETEREARRVSGRFRDEFEELLTDSDLTDRLAQSAREDGLEEATEGMETNVSF